MEDVKSRIAKDSRAFGSLRVPVSSNSNLSVPIKRVVYKAAVLSVLLYGVEMWTFKAEHVRRLNASHNKCVRTILGVIKVQPLEGEDPMQDPHGQVWHRLIHA